MTRPRRTQTGFTLIELLVVIGIFIVLSAIMLPIGRRLREGNAADTCQVRLSHLGQALKVYYLDEGGVPPVGVIDADENGEPDVQTVDLTLFPGLKVLFTLDYITDRETLHCPRHVTDASGAAVTRQSAEYFCSYTNQDADAKPGSGLAQYKYMPYRWATATDYPDDYRRQLSQGAIACRQADGVNYLVSASGGDLAPDNTIVTWCSYHAESYSLNGHPQYVALYWDGSIHLLDKELFTDTTVGPAEAWRVKPTDMAH